MASLGRFTVRPSYVLSVVPARVGLERVPAKITCRDRFECDLVDRLVRGRGELVVWSFVGKFLSRFSTGGSKRLRMINLLKNEPLRTATSVTKFLCDSWWNMSCGFARFCAEKSR